MPLSMHNGKFRWKGRARGVRHVPGVMNRAEQEYSLMLEARKKCDEIQDWWFEAITLKLAHDLRLTVDFFVFEQDGTLTCVDVKGCTKSAPNKQGVRKPKPRVEDDALAKLKMAANKFPFRVVMAFKSKDQGWMEQEVKAA